MQGLKQFMVKEFVQFASSTFFMDQVMFQSVSTPKAYKVLLNKGSMMHV